MLHGNRLRADDSENTLAATLRLVFSQGGT
jgi:hypothetical protein